MTRFGVRSPEQLRERIHVILGRRLEYTQRQVAREQVIAQIAAASTWDLPTDLLQRQARKALARKIMDMRATGIPEEEIVARQRLLQQDTLRSTALALKEHFVMQKIAEEEKLDVDDDDLNDEIDRIAVQNEEPPRRVRARLEKEDLLDALAAEILERKDAPRGGPVSANAPTVSGKVEGQILRGSLQQKRKEEGPRDQLTFEEAVVAAIDFHGAGVFDDGKRIALLSSVLVAALQVPDLLGFRVAA